MLGGSVEVTLAEDDHSDVGVEVDFARFRAREPVAWIDTLINGLARNEISFLVPA